jgi:hypothetical protein
VNHVLRRLVDAGIVDASSAGQATLYTLNREHVLAPAVTILSSAHRTLAGRMADLVAAWPYPPVVLALFGSAARRDGTASSDIDVLLLRPDDVPAEDQEWQVRRHGLAASMDRWSGNTTQIVEMSESEIRAAAKRKDPLVASLLEESRLVWGAPIREVLGMTSSGTRN